MTDDPRALLNEALDIAERWLAVVTGEVPAFYNDETRRSSRRLAELRAIAARASAEPGRTERDDHRMTREEFFAQFREAHAAFHRCWTAAVGTPDYHKEHWRLVDNALSRFARATATSIGVDRKEPLL